MKLNKIQLNIINSFISEFDCDSIIGGAWVNCYLLVAVESVKYYDGIDDDIRDYILDSYHKAGYVFNWEYDELVESEV